MSEWEVTEAKREALIGAIGFMGPSGAGKTLSALKVAYGFMKERYPNLDDDGIWKKIAVIDTERNRSKIYADHDGHGIGSFVHLKFPAPYDVLRLEDAMNHLVTNYGIELAIIDSITHFWENDGGLLDLQQKYGGNFQAWGKVNPHYNRFIQIITGEVHDIDVFSTIRSKQSYEVGQSDTGKLKVEKLGLKPVQRDSLEYEFHVTLALNMEHVAESVKDNSGLFDEQPRVLGPNDGKLLYGWLKSGEKVETEAMKQKRIQEEAKQKEKAERDQLMETFKVYETKGHFKTYEEIETIRKSKAAADAGGVENLPIDRLRKMVEYIAKKDEEYHNEDQTTQQESPQQKPSTQIYYLRDSQTGEIFQTTDSSNFDKPTIKEITKEEYDSLKEKIAKKEAAKQEAEGSDDPREGETQYPAYFYHAESDAVLVANNQKQYMEAVGNGCDEISKDRYDNLKAKIDQAENKPKEKTIKDFSLPQLKGFAKKYGVKGYSSMNKEELWESIRAAKEAAAHEERQAHAQ